jgi:hypothetical protein
MGRTPDASLVSLSKHYEKSHFNEWLFFCLRFMEGVELASFLFLLKPLKSCKLSSVMRDEV